MEAIKLMPHHARIVGDVYFLKQKLEVMAYGSDKKGKKHSENVIKKIISDPSQLVRIVLEHDFICEMCPKNPQGENYQMPEDRCAIDPSGSEQFLADYLGILRLAHSGEAVTSRTLLGILKKCPEYK